MTAALPLVKSLNVGVGWIRDKQKAHDQRVESKRHKLQEEIPARVERAVRSKFGDEHDKARSTV